MSRPIPGAALLITCVILAGTPELLSAQPSTITVGAGPQQFTRPSGAADHYHVGLSVTGGVLFPVHRSLAVTLQASGSRLAADNVTPGPATDVIGRGGARWLASFSTGIRAVTPRIGPLRGFGTMVVGVSRMIDNPPTYSWPGSARVDGTSTSAWWNARAELQLGVQARLSETQMIYLGPSFTHLFKSFPGRPPRFSPSQLAGLRGGIGFQL